MSDHRIVDPDKTRVAEWLRQAADLLQAQGANAFRVGAYRKAATAVEQCHSLRTLFAAGGRDGLDALPGIGPGIASAIAEMLQTGRWAQLERLRGSVDPTALFQAIPGIGPEFAQRIHDTLGVETLEALEVACHEGRLEEVAGVGRRRAAAIRAALSAILDHSRIRHRATASASAGQQVTAEPDVEVLLDVDREYRGKANAGTLPTIAPRRFNPEQKAWLPVLHTTRDDWQFTALYSNTATAHELARTHDSVVLYFHDADRAERQRTVVTEHRGALASRRVVRGREPECRAFYERTRIPVST